MTVPDPKPVERAPMTRMRTTVSHGLGLEKAGAGRSASSSRRAETLRRLPFWLSSSWSLVVVILCRAAIAVRADVRAGVLGWSCLGRGSLVEPCQLACGSRPRNSAELTPGAIDHDERGHAFDAVAPLEIGFLVDIDPFDRISVADQLLDGRAGLMAWAAPLRRGS